MTTARVFYCLGIKFLNIPSIKLKYKFHSHLSYFWSRHSSVGTATHYELGCPGIKFRWRRNFLYPSKTALRPTQPLLQWVRGLCWGKTAGPWRWPPTPSSAEVKERVELYIYSPSGSSWPNLGRNLPLLLPLPRSLLVSSGHAARVMGISKELH